MGVLMNKWTIMLVPVALMVSACGSQPERPAPVTDQTVGSQTPGGEAKTFGYVDTGVPEATPAAHQLPPAGSERMPSGGEPLSVVSESAPPARATPNLEPSRISEQAPPDQASSNTVLALLQTAEGQQKAGNLGGAAATMERALRIQPHNAVLWHQLANVRYQQGQYARAASLAGKSNSLGGGNADLRRNNMLLIAKAKRAQGDEVGAREAEMKSSGGN
jgi:hypothetical protein